MPSSVLFAVFVSCLCFLSFLSPRSPDSSHFFPRQQERQTEQLHTVCFVTDDVKVIVLWDKHAAWNEPPCFHLNERRDRRESNPQPAQSKPENALVGVKVTNAAVNSKLKAEADRDQPLSGEWDSFSLLISFTCFLSSSFCSSTFPPFFHFLTLLSSLLPFVLPACFIYLYSLVSFPSSCPYRFHSVFSSSPPNFSLHISSS